MTETLPEGCAGRIESFVTEWLSDARVPGAALAVVDGDGLAYESGFGARDLSTNRRATPGTLFGIGSCTKSFTTLAIHRLAEAGELDVRDPAGEYVPLAAEFPGDPVTIHELMSHTSGMPSDGMATALIPRYVGLDPVEVPLSGEQDFERHVRGAMSDRDDADRFFYYNSGYTLLGDVVEAVTGRSYASYVREEILDPLGMERSTFSAAEFRDDPDRMTPYYDDDGRSTAGEFPFDERIRAAGGLLSSVDELAAYLRLQMTGRVDDTELVAPDRLAEMHDRHSTRRVTLDGVEQGYGHGWMVRDFLGDTLVGHGGSVGVSTAYVGFLRDAEVGVALVCNAAANPHPMHVGPAVLAVQQGDDPTAVPQFALREKFEPVTGTYESYRGIVTAEVEADGGTLELTLSSPTDERKLPLVPDSLRPDEHSFHTVTEAGVRTPAVFESTDDGTDLFFERWRLHRD